MRDNFEIKMIKASLEAGIPVLGICRGIQVMNVALGGTLYEDMCGHKQGLDRHMPSHSVSTSGALSGIYPPVAKVNSFHHQAVKDVAPSLDKCAESDDGYTEGIYMPSHTFFVGVQWHPEHMLESDMSAKRLFETFIHNCDNYRKGRKNDKGSRT